VAALMAPTYLRYLPPVVASSCHLLLRASHYRNKLLRKKRSHVLRAAVSTSNNELLVFRVCGLDCVLRSERVERTF
jgi:hypothetical protein